MGSINRVLIVGNLGRDAELRYTSGGTPVATLSIATTDVWKDKAGKKQEQTEWHRVVVWGDIAEKLSEYLTKGKQVGVEGKLQTRKWQDKDGNDKYSTEIRADRVTLLGSKGDGGTQQARGGKGRNNNQRTSSRNNNDDDQGYGDDLNDDGDVQAPEGNQIADDDIPF